MKDAGPDHTYVYGVVPLKGDEFNTMVLPAQYEVLVLDAVIEGD